MFKVIKAFADKEDNNKVYGVGDTYPRPDYEPSVDRIAFLMSNNTALGEPVIASIEEDNVEVPKRTSTRKRRKENE